MSPNEDNDFKHERFGYSLIKDMMREIIENAVSYVLYETNFEVRYFLHLIILIQEIIYILLLLYILERERRLQRHPVT